MAGEKHKQQILVYVLFFFYIYGVFQSSGAIYGLNQEKKKYFVEVTV